MSSSYQARPTPQAPPREEKVALKASCTVPFVDKDPELTRRLEAMHARVQRVADERYARESANLERLGLSRTIKTRSPPPVPAATPAPEATATPTPSSSPNDDAEREARRKAHLEACRQRDLPGLVWEGPVQEEVGTSSAPDPAVVATTVPLASAPPQERARRQVRWMQRVNGTVDLTQAYEDPTLQAQARQCIPVALLMQRARASLQADGKPLAPEATPDADALALELVRWFKNDFFTFVPTKGFPCSCGAPSVPAVLLAACPPLGAVDITRVASLQICPLPERTPWECSCVSRGMAEPWPEEAAYRCQVVEAWECPCCRTLNRFPRYNDCRKLLATRRGRCGEFANCFALCARSLGYDVRLCTEWSDHIWVELYSRPRGRWVHYDPCEGCSDTPLMYECGWGKQISYVIACSFEGICDVTWRYTKDPAAVLERRQEVTEEYVTRAVSTHNMKILRYVAPTRREVLLARWAAEQQELEARRQATPENLSGPAAGTAEVQPRLNLGRQ
ncbi:putative Peptide-N-asparagine amidase [Paratrimastix pyriformis]|uniref:Peptide-N-asparagine amidase n=1 Tax=Paratrimastix pyriformis TaxID=342808 RepID=A0ABQ8UPM8_9EUKA|nr:putative Peptide-N-asparagine amidase [Paratrimastix pyriformis]